MRIALIALLLSGCATERVVTEYRSVEVPRYITVLPPSALLEPCPSPSLELETNQDLEAALAAAIINLGRCNEDKNAIRDFLHDSSNER